MGGRRRGGKNSLSKKATGVSGETPSLGSSKSYTVKNSKKGFNTLEEEEKL